MSHQSWQQDPVEIEMIKAHEEIFPNFYAIPTHELDRVYVKEAIDFVTYLATWFRWLPVAILQDSGDLLRVFDRWRRWRVERRPGEGDEDNGWTPYYSHRRFHTEFLEFVRSCYLPEMANASAAIAAIAQTENTPAREPRKPVVQETNRLDGTAVPYKLESLFAVDVEVDYKELIERLRNKTDLNEVRLVMRRLFSVMKITLWRCGSYRRLLEYCCVCVMANAPWPKSRVSLSFSISN